jgi:hypothetical protein
VGGQRAARSGRDRASRRACRRSRARDSPRRRRGGGRVQPVSNGSARCARPRHPLARKRRVVTDRAGDLPFTARAPLLADARENHTAPTRSLPSSPSDANLRTPRAGKESPRPSHDAHDPRLPAHGRPGHRRACRQPGRSRDRLRQSRRPDRAASAEVATAVKPVLLRRKLTTAQARPNSLGCASQQDSRKGARRGREEASKVACPDREEGKAQATEEDLARQVDKSSTGRSPRSR